jgi:hypothetical protein
MEVEGGKCDCGGIVGEGGPRFHEDDGSIVLVMGKVWLVVPAYADDFGERLCCVMAVPFDLS